MATVFPAELKENNSESNSFFALPWRSLPWLGAFDGIGGSFRKLEFKFRHPHFSAAELHAFGFQSETLFKTGFAGKGDPACGGHHAMPGKSVGLVQRADHLTGSARKTGGAGDRAIA